MFAIGLVLFSLASLTCGLATTSLMLNLSRAAQGVGGAIMFATSLALIAQAFAGKERGTAIGVYGAVVGGAVAVGPLVGGAITTGIGWRWIFFINIPIGVVAVIITLTKVENARIPTGRRIDWLGFVTFTSSLFLLVYALVQGNAKGWGSTYIVSMLVASAVLMVVFLIGEWRQKDPMLDLGLFKRPAMVGVSLGSFTLSASIFAMFLYLTLYMQEILGYSALAAGLRFLPLTMLAFIVAPIAGKLTVRIQTRFLMSLGLALVAIGCQLMTHVGGTSSWLVLLPGFLVCGVGIGITNPVLASGSVSVVPPERSGMSTGAASTFRQVGIATGIAGLGAIFVHQIKPAVVANLQGSLAGNAVLAHGGQGLGTALASGGVRQAAASIPSHGRPSGAAHRLPGRLRHDVQPPHVDRRDHRPGRRRRLPLPRPPEGLRPERGLRRVVVPSPVGDGPPPGGPGAPGATPAGAGPGAADDSDPTHAADVRSG